MCAQNTVCAKCALKIVSDHTIPIRKWPLIRPKSDHCQTIVQPWPRLNPNHCPDDCARQMTSDHTIPRPKMPLIRPSSKHLPTTSRPLSRRLCDHGPHQTQTIVPTIVQVMTSDQTIPIRKWPLIRPFPSASDLWSDHSHPQVTYDQTIPIRNQNPDPVIMVWEHTVCVGLRMIRGHFRMAPQPGYNSTICRGATESRLRIKMNRLF